MPSETEPTSAPSATAGSAGQAGQEALYQAALGPVHAEHYLPVFARFDERGANGPAWNTAAAVGNLGWLVYRQLWGAAGEFAVALGVWALIAVGLALWVDFLPLGVRAGLALALLLLLLLVPGLYGTALLHAQVRRRMIAAVKQAATIDEACTLLRWQGDAERRRGTWGVAGLLLAAVLVGWAWLFWPTQATGQRTLSDEASSVDRAASASEAASIGAPAQPQPDTPPVATAAAFPEPAAAAAQSPPQAEAQTAPPTAATAAVAASAETAPAAALPVEPASAEVAVRIKGHGVNVGLFAVRANAERAQAQLEAAGLPVLSDPIESARGALTRVRVGPFDSREQAQAAAVRVRALGLDARLYSP